MGTKVKTYQTDLQPKLDLKSDKTTSDIPSIKDVGGIKNGDVISSGTDLQGFITDLINPVLDPTKEDNYVTLDGVTPQTLEIGTHYTTQLSPIYNKGIIHSKDGHPDIPLTGDATSVSYSRAGVNTSTGAVDTHITEGSNYWSCVQEYAAGIGSYYDSLGVESHIFDNDRVAANVSSNSNIITGKYYYWKYAGTSTSPTDSAGVRGLQDKAFWPASNFSISIPIGNKEVAFYVPDTAGIATIKYVESSNADVTDTFTITTFTVNDANGQPVTYRAYMTTIGGTGYTAVATYDIIFN